MGEKEGRDEQKLRCKGGGDLKYMGTTARSVKKEAKIRGREIGGVNHSVTAHIKAIINRIISTNPKFGTTRKTEKKEEENLILNRSGSAIEGGFNRKKVQVITRVKKERTTERGGLCAEIGSVLGGIRNERPPPNHRRTEQECKVGKEGGKTGPNPGR